MKIQKLEGDVEQAVSKQIKDTSRPCLIQRINESNLVEAERTPDRLLQEAEQFIVAGSETTGNTLTVTTFHILQNPDVQYKLRQELRDANIQFDHDINVAALQNLPYLV